MDVSKSLRMQSDTEKSACDHVGDQTLATQDCSHHIQAMVSFDPARMAWPGNPYNATTPTKVNGKCQESAPLGCQSIHSTSWRPNHRAKIGPFFCQSSQFVCHLFCLDKNLTNLANLHQELDVFSNFQELERLSLEGPSKLWTSDPSPLFHILQHWSCKEMNLSPKQPIRRYNCPDSSIVRSSCCVDTICAKCNLGIYPWPYLPFAELIVWCWCQRSQAASTTESVWPCLKKGSRHG